MRKFFCCMIVWMTAVFLVSCTEDSVLILSGESEDDVLLSQESGQEDEAGGAGRAEDEKAGPGVMVHICGCVINPGVYEVPDGSRVYEVIGLAGGFAPGAAESFLNLAETVSDGQKLVVPSLDEVESDPYGQAFADGVDGLININTADKGRLMTLPGIGETRAEAIIAWRETNGAFRTTEEIMQVSGIKEAAYEKIKQLITVE